MAPQRRALSLIAILALGQPVLAQNAPPLTAEQEEVFALLDRFDPLDTRSLQFR